MLKRYKSSIFFGALWEIPHLSFKELAWSIIENGNRDDYGLFKIEVGWLVDEIQDLAKDVANVAFKFVPRVCNLVAHKLSKLALLKPNCCIWLSEAPLELIALLSCDDYLSH
ncbi:hypothetical protein WN943_029742 [Citrus x changshan-huyou]